MANQQPEAWEVKMFSAKDVSSLFEEAHEQYNEYNTNKSKIQQCDICKEWTAGLAPHWNDVGSMYDCKSCYCESLVDFWMQEKAAGAKCIGPGSSLPYCPVHGDPDYDQGPAD